LTRSERFAAGYFGRDVSGRICPRPIDGKRRGRKDHQSNEL